MQIVLKTNGRHIAFDTGFNGNLMEMLEYAAAVEEKYDSTTGKYGYHISMEQNVELVMIKDSEIESDGIKILASTNKELSDKTSKQWMENWTLQKKNEELQKEVKELKDKLQAVLDKVTEFNEKGETL
jgi:hypothetical protein